MTADTFPVSDRHPRSAHTVFHAEAPLGMRFGAKIGLVLLAVGVLPVALLGWVSYTVSRDELQRTVGRMQTQAAEDLALFTERSVQNAVTALRLSTATLPIEEFSPGELAEILALPYRQLSFLSIIAIVDDARGPVAGPVYRPVDQADYPDRVPVTVPELDAFARRLPVPPAEVGRAAWSGPYRNGAGPARMAVALRLGPNRSAAAEIVLRDVEARVAELSSASAVSYLVDRQGEVIAHADPGAVLTPEERRLFTIGFERDLAWHTLLHRADGQRWLAAFSPVRSLGWGAVVAQPMAVAFSASERLMSYTVQGALVALVVALLVGAVLATGVTRPVQRLSRAAGAIARGDYGVPVDASGRDELADLGRAFASMTAEIRRRDEEIRGWNRELQARVEERSTELKNAQDQILRTRRLAALGSLGAGVAHELNNPMTAITGYLAILKKQLAGAPQQEMVLRAQEQAARISRVVEDLRSFADQERSSGGKRFPLAGPLRAALDLYEERLRAAKIEVHTRIEDGVPDAQGDPVQIQQVVAHLVENAINAMPEGGKLDVSLGAVDGDALRLRIADTGRGIPPGLRERIFDPFFTTKPQAGRVGLGLSVSHSIVEAHHGRIMVESEEGAGAAVTVVLPAATAAHLV
jgi:signal transduction histidine kinase